MAIQSVLVDETIFVYSQRGNFSLFSQLGLFLGLSEKTKDESQRYKLYLTEISAKRLGWYPIYSKWGYFRFRKERVKEYFEKRVERMGIARSIITRPTGLIPKNFYKEGWLRPFKRRGELMDLFMHANEAKSAAIKEKDPTSQMSPEDVIPLDDCAIARIAHKKKLPIFSFNTDFQYFCRMPNDRKQYIIYWNPETFLKTLHP